MSATAAGTWKSVSSPFGRYEFTIKRLHSLTGVIPVGAFLVEHFYTNAHAMYGETVYNEAVYSLNSIPYIVLVELLGIWLPIAFHGILGIYLWWTGSINVDRYPYARNWLYVFQRLSGVFLLAFIAIHTAEYRFGGMRWDGFYGGLTRHMKDGGAFAFYCAGVIAATFHLANGLNTFAMSWGLARSEAGQRRVGALCALVFAAMCGVGIHTLWHFRRESPDRRGKPPIFFRQDIHAGPAAARGGGCGPERPEGMGTGGAQNEWLKTR
ncbi:MAG: succinate dehydrogenase [Planctomycetota bacterium]|nr:succinate dehydrogenase [Planctomycetota bacterium]